MSDNSRRAFAKGVGAVTLGAGTVLIDLVRIEPGEFTMGSPEGEEGHAPNEAPMRRVCISKAFYLGRFEITHAQYRAVMGEGPGSADEDTLPVHHISYANGVEFCRRLAGKTNVEIHLPTEAQWEYACRASSRTRFYSGSSEGDLGRVAWYSGNAEGAHPVGQKLPNAWGLYDMHGNVWEYCADFIDDYATMAGTDPVGRVTPHHGAMRGGGWMHGPEECRAATRLISDDMFGGAGLRIAVDPE
jgi:formylglycine-generating enzyme required for sulfatase activity